MDQERYEEKKESASSHSSDDGDLTPTPAKITEPPPRNKNKQTVLLSISEVEEIQVPDKCKPLAEFYDAVQTSIRLLSLTKKLPSFKNICAIVKILTQRMLLSCHFAQIKHVLPEAIHIEKILVHDEKTLCMMPDMKVTLLLDKIQALPHISAYMVARQIFHQRLLDFFNSNYESCEIPEAMLPEPFCRSNHIVLPEISSVNSSIESHIECEPSLAAFSCGQAMKKHFSQKIVVPETEKTELLASLVPPVYDSKETDVIAKNSPWKECSLASDSAITASPAALIFSPHCSNFSGSESPAKPNSLLDPVTLQTPGQPTPAKRPLQPSTCKKSNNETNILSHTAAKRSLTFEGKEYMDDSLQPEETKNIATDDCITVFRFTQVVDGYKNQTMNTGKRQEMIASLTDLINMIQRIFKYANASLLTKQELLQKIIAQSLDIVEIREVEEQLELLEELVPDWIFHKLVPTAKLSC